MCDPTVPPPRDQWARLGLSEIEGQPEKGIIALDIGLAVGDGARRMTYVELAEARENRCPPRGALSYVIAGRDKGEMTALSE